jgi:pimeloyl-ACP methyl ester carboxylesterase
MEKKKKYPYPLALLFVSTWLCLMPAFLSDNIDEVNNIDVNGVNIVYQVKGNSKDKPVILLHGNSGEHDHLSIMVDQLDSAGYLVYALDSRGQGANQRLSEYHYKDMAADVYEFIKLKGLEKPAVFGFSDGGIIALQLEVMYPGTLGAIVTGGANIFVEGALIPEFAEGFLAQPSTEPLVIMLQTEPEMTVEEINTIQCPALIMSGEHDLIQADHTRLIGENIPGARMKIIPGEDHGSYICNSPKLSPLILDFFRQIGY